MACGECLGVFISVPGEIRHYNVPASAAHGGCRFHIKGKITPIAGAFFVLFIALLREVFDAGF
jgi:hypothetical protein